MSKVARCAQSQPDPVDDDPIAWGRSVVAQPSPLLTDYERGLIAALVIQAEAEVAR